MLIQTQFSLTEMAGSKLVRFKERQRMTYQDEIFEECIIETNYTDNECKLSKCNILMIISNATYL